MTIVTHDEASWSQQVAVKRRLHVTFVPIFVCVNKDDVKLTGQFLDRSLSWTFDKRDSITEAMFLEGPARSRNHLGIQLQGDDLGLGIDSTLIPSQGAVARIATDLENLPWSGPQSSVIESFLSVTSLGTLVLSKELHGGTLQRRRHLVRVLEVGTSPVPHLLHGWRFGEVGDFDAIVGDSGGHLRLVMTEIVSLLLRQQRQKKKRGLP